MNFVAGTVCLLPQNKFSEALRLYNTYIWTSLGSLIALTEVCWLSETQRAIPTLLLHLLWEYGEGGLVGWEGLCHGYWHCWVVSTTHLLTAVTSGL